VVEVVCDTFVNFSLTKELAARVSLLGKVCATFAALLVPQRMSQLRSKARNMLVSRDVQKARTTYLKVKVNGERSIRVYARIP